MMKGEREIRGDRETANLLAWFGCFAQVEGGVFPLFFALNQVGDQAVEPAPLHNSGQSQARLTPKQSAEKGRWKR